MCAGGGRVRVRRSVGGGGVGRGAGAAAAPAPAHAAPGRHRRLARRGNYIHSYYYNTAYYKLIWL